MGNTQAETACVCCTPPLAWWFAYRRIVLAGKRMWTGSPGGRVRTDALPGFNGALNQSELHRGVGGLRYSKRAVECIPQPPRGGMCVAGGSVAEW